MLCCHKAGAELCNHPGGAITCTQRQWQAALLQEKVSALCCTEDVAKERYCSRSGRADARGTMKILLTVRARGGGRSESIGDTAPYRFFSYPLFSKHGKWTVGEG